MRHQILEVIFVILTGNLSVVKNHTHGPQKYLHHLKELQGHTSMRHMALRLVFLPVDGDVSWLLLPSLVSLLSSSILQPENTYFYILEVTGNI